MGMVLPAGSRGLIAPGMPQVLNPAHFAVRNGLVGYWGFDPDCLDFARTLAIDISGNGNAGTLINLASTAMAVGKVGSGLSFDGSSTRISIPDSAALRQSKMSICAWIYPTATGSRSSLFSNGNSNTFATNNYICNISTSGRLGFFGRTPTAQVFSNTNAYTLNAWNHVCYVCDGTTIKFYSNGQNVGSSSATIGTDSVVGSQIGADKTSDVQFFTGTIDDVRVYNRVLDPWEVIQLHQVGLAGRRDAGQLLPQDCEMDMMAIVVDFKRSLSQLGTRAGSRQRMAG